MPQKKLVKKSKKQKSPTTKKSKKRQSFREIIENSIQTPII